jgi:hypothetical protein
VTATQIEQRESASWEPRPEPYPAPVAAASDFNFIQGEVAVTVISDGFITVPIDIVAPERSSDERAQILSRTGNQNSGRVESKTNIPLISRTYKATDVRPITIAGPGSISGELAAQCGSTRSTDPVRTSR